MSDVPIINVGVEGVEKIDQLNKKLDTLGEYSEKSKSSIGVLRRELRDAKSDMLTFAEGTEQYNKALVRASQLQGKLKETNDIIRASIRDLGEVTKKVGGAVGGLASGFQVAQGVMSLFGAESEASLKVIQNITAAMSVTQGIVQFANGFDDLQDILTGFRAQAAMTNDAVGEMSDVAKEAGTNLGNVAKEGAVIGSNLAGGAVAANTMSDSVKNLNKTVSEGTSDELAKIERTIKVRLIKNSLIKDEIQKAKSAGSDITDLLEKEALSNDLINKYKEKRLKLIDEIYKDENKVADTNKKVVEGQEKFGANLGKQLLTMGLWIAAIAAVTYGIAKLIEWMNKIPEDVKIKIDIQGDVFKELTKNQIKIKTFLNDYNKAIKDVNTNRITELEKYAKKEFDLTDEALKKYKKSDLEKLESSKELFKNYLKIAEDTYWNESIIKRKVEAQQAGQTSLKKAQSLYAYQKTRKGSALLGDAGFRWEEYVRMAYDGSLTEKAIESLLVNGVDQQIVDELRNVSIQNKIIKGLPKMRNVDMGTGSGKPTEDKSKKSLTLDTKQQVRPDLTDPEQFFKPILDAEIKYTNEEQVILEDAYKKRSKYYYNTVISEIEFNIKREKARKDDLNNELTYQYGQKMLLQSEVDRFDEVKTLYNADVVELNNYKTKKANYQNLITAAQEEFTKLGDKATAKDKKRIEDKIKLYQDEIVKIDENIESKQKEIATLTEQLKLYEGYPDKMKEITDKIAALNLEIADSTRTAAQLERDAWAERFQNVKDYVDAIGKVNDAFMNMTSDQMEIIDNRTQKEKNDLELSKKYRQADSDSQQKMMYELELANYNQKKKIFETNKAFQISSAIITGISGELDAISNFLKNGGWTNPLAIANLAAETIAITTGTIMTVKKIASTTLDKPVPPSAAGGLSGGAGGANVALNPSKDTLTSNEERLNASIKNNIKDTQQSVVKVTEINDVQSKVKVREQNSSF